MSKTIAYSLRPDLAFYVSMGALTILTHREKIEAKNILIHSCGYVGEEDKKEGESNLIKDGGIKTLDLAPDNAILGWGKIAEIKEYDNQTFAYDKERHWAHMSFQSFKSENAMMGVPVYGYVLIDVFYLQLPVIGIGGQRIHGEIWEAETPFDALCFNKAIKETRVIAAKDLF